jgi:hypothetical protein
MRDASTCHAVLSDPKLLSALSQAETLSALLQQDGIGHAGIYVQTSKWNTYENELHGSEVEARPL